MKRILLAAAVVVAGMAFTQKPLLAYTDQYYPWCLNYNGSLRCVYKTLNDCLRDRIGLGGQCDMNPY